jgi:hypothetical protein
VFFIRLFEQQRSFVQRRTASTRNQCSNFSYEQTRWGQAGRSLDLQLLANPFEVRKITHWFYFGWLDPRISWTEMKAARKRTSKLSRLLEAALDAALVIAVGYALILLSLSQALF